MVDCAIQEWGDFGFDRGLEMSLRWRISKGGGDNGYLAFGFCWWVLVVAGGEYGGEGFVGVRSGEVSHTESSGW